MNKYFSIYLICNCLVLFGCNNSATPGKVNTKDSLYIREYYSDGPLKRASMRKKGIKDGTDKWYYENGAIMIAGSNKDGQPDGTWTFYYKTGKVKETYTYLDSKVFGSDLYYFENGKIERFIFRTQNARKIYERYYDSLGNVMGEKGFPYSISYNADLHVNDIYEPWFFLGLLSDWTGRTTIKDITNGKNTIVKDTILSNPPDADAYWRLFRIQYLCKEKGTFYWTVEMKIDDKKYRRKLSKIDTLKFTVQ